MIRIAFYLGGSAFVGFHDQWDGASTRGHGRGKIHRHAVDVVLTLSLLGAEGDDVLLWSATTHAQHTGASKAGRGSHQL